MRAIGIFASLTFLFFNRVTFADNDALLQKIIQRAQESKSNSIVIVQNERTIYSNFYGGRDQVRSVASVTKSICALAVGVLLDQGKISSLDQPMYTWIPSWRLDGEKSKISLQMIMNHTSGLPDVNTETGFWLQPDAVKAAENTKLETQPGSHYLYSNIATSLLQPVIEQAARQSVTDFVKDSLLTPLEITDSSWGKDRVGHEITSGGLFLSTADLVKVGIMLLQKGVYKGRRLIYENTLQTLVTRSQPFFPYGLLFWLEVAPSGESLFSARGWGGQWIVIYPEKNLIVVRTKDPFQVELDKREAQSFRDCPSLVAMWN